MADPEGVNAKDAEFGERWDWQVRYDVEDNGILPQNSCVAMDTAGKHITFEETGGYNRSGLKVKLPLVKRGQRPHLVPGIAASSLWCTKCYGWRPVGQEVRNSYSTLSREWEILRAIRPCKCGYQTPWRSTRRNPSITNPPGRRSPPRSVRWAAAVRDSTRLHTKRATGGCPAMTWKTT